MIVLRWWRFEVVLWPSKTWRKLELAMRGYYPCAVLCFYFVAVWVWKTPYAPRWGRNLERPHFSFYRR